ncbi:hypothetical protein F5877DRAFT_65061 [Lentinula edodes]|nr:hypothetical protein F5877DRAFT_65061 [Lentinula edodes]
MELQHHSRPMVLTIPSSTSTLSIAEKSIVTGKHPSSILPTDNDSPDEAPRAWIVLFGAMCIAFTTSGYMSTWGVFQAHYEQSLLKDISPSSISSPQETKVVRRLLLGYSQDPLLQYYRNGLFDAEGWLWACTLQDHLWALSMDNTGVRFNHLVRTGNGKSRYYTCALNLMVPATCLSAAIYYIWPFSHSQVGLIFLSVFYGISIGPFASLFSGPVLDLGDRNQLGQRIGILMSMVGVAMLAGAPISGAINTSQGSVSMGLFAGTVAQILFHFQNI